LSVVIEIGDGVDERATSSGTSAKKKKGSKRGKERGGKGDRDGKGTEKQAGGEPIVLQEPEQEDMA